MSTGRIDMAGKVALVTGANSGIGLVTDEVAQRRLWEASARLVGIA